MALLSASQVLERGQASALNTSDTTTGVHGAPHVIATGTRRA